MSAPSVAVVGHPFGPLGISRVARCSFASFRAAGADVKLVDVWKPDPGSRARPARAGRRQRDLADCNLFHLNGDEIDGALEHLGGLPNGSRNVICPMWELPRYPSEWARQLEQFDEVWAGSRFIADAIRPAVAMPVVHLPLATQLFPRPLRSRRYFGIPEGSYAFLFSFDMRSYVGRKNPWAVLSAFARFLVHRPLAQACLVLKVHGTTHSPKLADELRRRIAELDARAVLIDRQMDENDAHALTYACDAYVSLHRAEGYGLALAEAMCLGKPVVATSYSGNMDFMAPDVARLIPYQLVPVPEGGYPHWRDQVWADPDIDAAAAAMLELYDDPDAGRRMGRRASEHMQAHFSFRATGLRYVAQMSRPATGGSRAGGSDGQPDS